MPRSKTDERAGSPPRRAGPFGHVLGWMPRSRAERVRSWCWPMARITAHGGTRRPDTDGRTHGRPTASVTAHGPQNGQHRTPLPITDEGAERVIEREDTKAVVVAAAQAQRAADHIL